MDCGHIRAGALILFASKRPPHIDISSVGLSSRARAVSVTLLRAHPDFSKSQTSPLLSVLSGLASFSRKSSGVVVTRRHVEQFAGK